MLLVQEHAFKLNAMLYFKFDCERFMGWVIKGWEGYAWELPSGLLTPTVPWVQLH